MKSAVTTLLILAIFLCIYILYKGSTDIASWLPTKEAAPETAIGTFQEWTSFTAPDGSFVVLLPTIPESQQDQIPIEGLNKTASYNLYSALNPDGDSFTISTITYPEEVNMTDPVRPMQKLMTDLVAANSDNHLQSSSLETSFGHPSLSFIILRGDVTMANHVIADGQTLYVLSLISVAGHPLDEAAYKHFVESFQIKAIPSKPLTQ